MRIVVLFLTKMVLVQVKVSLDDSILALECIQERLAGVPPTQPVRYIVNEMYGMQIGRNLEEGRQAAGFLTLSPLFGTVAQHSIDVIIEWALIGEWSSRVLFPPEGQWPRHGHPQCIGELYMQRSPSLTAWARACFEQGALASLLYLPGIVPVFTLPGDRMFQSTPFLYLSLHFSFKFDHHFGLKLVWFTKHVGWFL